MTSNELVSIKQVKIHHNLDDGFMERVESCQLIEFVFKESEKFMYVEQLPVLEQIIRLHFDLQVNMEGIDVITQMLKRMDKLQQTIQHLENRLRLYE
ncbi:MAG: chaperone modulator CbpM [Draconibacterium sp.]